MPFKMDLGAPEFLAIDADHRCNVCLRRPLEFVQASRVNLDLDLRNLIRTKQPVMSICSSFPPSARPNPKSASTVTNNQSPRTPSS